MTYMDYIRQSIQNKFIELETSDDIDRLFDEIDYLDKVVNREINLNVKAVGAIVGYTHLENSLKTMCN